MKSATAVPYKRATPGRLKASPWELIATEAPLPLPPIFSGLDYGATLRLRRKVTVDIAGLRSDCGLAADVPLIVAASWSSAGTSLRRSLVTTNLPNNAPSPTPICLTGSISGGDIAGTLHLETSILLAHTEKRWAPLTAWRAGSILLLERHVVRLDASTSFFPVEVVDFKNGYWANPDAGWMLSWNIFALEQPFLGSVRLFINATHPRVIRAVSGEALTADASAIRTAIYFDVAKTLVHGALANEEFVERGGNYAEGSCGKVLYTLIQLLFPGDPLRKLATAATQRPDYFNSDLQGRLKIFGS